VVVLGVLVAWVIQTLIVKILLAPVGRVLLVRVVAALLETPALREMQVQLQQV